MVTHLGIIDASTLYDKAIGFALAELDDDNKPVRIISKHQWHSDAVVAMIKEQRTF